MKQISTNWNSNIKAASRQIVGKVEVYSGTNLLYTLLSTDYLQSIDIENTSDIGKFFGFTMCQKATVNAIDINGAFNFQSGQKLVIQLGTKDGLDNIEYVSYPSFFIDTVEFDSVAKTYRITAYDFMNDIGKHTISEVSLTYPITIANVAATIASYLGVSVSWSETPQTITYTEAINIDGSETLRDILKAIAEATGFICYIRDTKNIYFKKLSNANIDLEITQSDYYSLQTEENIQLTKVIAVTELGDNVSYGTDDGFAQIMRDNPFLYNRSDIQTILQNILTTHTFKPFSLNWRGNPALEIGDYVRIYITANTSFYMWYLGESIYYDGGLTSIAEWDSSEQENVDSTPATLGAIINETTAKVNKVDKEITLIASETQNNSSSIGELRVNTDNIIASVQNVDNKVDSLESSVAADISELQSKVELAVSAEEVNIAITSAINSGAVQQITTTTGFKFDSEGLTISKTDSDISTTIDEDGMQVSKNNQVMLTANNTGVDAKNLHATTYLIIGNNIRFEDWGSNATACFWIKN